MRDRCYDNNINNNRVTKNKCYDKNINNNIVARDRP